MFLISKPCAWADDLIKFPTGPAAWTVSVTRKAPASPPTAGHPGNTSVVFTSVAVTQDDHFRRTVITYSSGAARESWSIPNLNLFLMEDPGGTVFITHRDPDPFGPGAFSWIKSEFLKDKNPVIFQSHKCFHYQGDVIDPYVGPITHEAWIDSSTLLPVALDDGTELGVFTPQQPSGSSLTPPAKFNKIVINAKKAMGVQ